MAKAATAVADHVSETAGAAVTVSVGHISAGSEGYVPWTLPTTHLIQVVRPLVAGQDLAVLEALGHVSYVAVLGPIAFVIAYFRLKTRLFD